MSKKAVTAIVISVAVVSFVSGGVLGVTTTTCIPNTFSKGPGGRL